MHESRITYTTYPTKSLNIPEYPQKRAKKDILVYIRCVGFRKEIQLALWGILGVFFRVTGGLCSKLYYKTHPLDSLGEFVRNCSNDLMFGNLEEVAKRSKFDASATVGCASERNQPQLAPSLDALSGEARARARTRIFLEHSARRKQGFRMM